MSDTNENSALKQEDKHNALTNFIILKYDKSDFNTLVNGKSIKEDLISSIYKVSVITGDQPEANTSASVYIAFINENFATKPILLQKNGCTKHFARGSKERFFLRAPKLTDMQHIMIRISSSSKKESWYLRELKIEETDSNRSWYCKANQWFSEEREDRLVCKILKVTSPEEPEITYDVLMKVEDIRNGNFNLPLFIKLNGSYRNSVKLPLNNNAIQRNECLIKFIISTQQVGVINSIRLGIHDSYEGVDQQSHSAILIKKVFIKSQEEESNFYVAVNNKWIGYIGKSFNYLDLICAPKDLEFTMMNKDLAIVQKNKESTKYDIMIWKCDSQFINDQSSVYIQLYGQMGKWTEVCQLSDIKRVNGNLVDRFRVVGENVGSLRKIRIWHNKAGLASAWHLEKVKIIRYLSEKEIYITVTVMKRQGKLPSYLDVIDGKIIIKPIFYEIKDYNPRILNSITENPDQNKRNEVGDETKESNKSLTKESYSSDFQENLEIPYAEESLFYCHTWLTLEEIDQTMEKTFPLSDKRYLNSSVKMTLFMSEN